MVHAVDAQQRCCADAIADPSAQHSGSTRSSRQASVVQSPTWLKPVIPASRAGT